MMRLSLLIICKILKVCNDLLIAMQLIAYGLRLTANRFYSLRISISNTLPFASTSRIRMTCFCTKLRR